MKQVSIHTDGACQGNPGPGGWAAVLRYGSQVREVSGGEPATTNNRMEMQGAIAGLSALREPCQIEFYTDSEYLKNGMTLWLKGWKARHWIRLDKKPIKNEDLWRQLDALAARHSICWHWVRGHHGNCDNERCDELARAAAERVRQTHSPAELRTLKRHLRQALHGPTGA